MNTKIAIYDFNTCRPALEAHAKELAQSQKGMARWAVLREFIVKFADQAATHSTSVLGQFDPDIVFAFVPTNRINANDRELLWGEVLEKACALMDVHHHHPYWIDFLDAITGGEGPKSAACRYSWVPSELLNEILLPQTIAIWVFFHAQRFLETTILPQLQKRGFVWAAAETEELCPYLRIRHPRRPQSVFRIPWADWFRDMIGGGYNLLYMLALASVYLQKLDHAVSESGQTQE